MEKSFEDRLKGLQEITELDQELGRYDEDSDKHLEELLRLEEILESYDALAALGSVDIPVDITNEEDFIKWIKGDTYDIKN